MSRALLYLFLRLRRNGLMRFLRGLAQPRKLLITTFWIALIGVVVYSQSQLTHAVRPSDAAVNASLTGFLGLLLAAAVLGGVLQQGPTFQPAEIDFLFGAPFKNRELLMYRMLSLYPLTVFSSVFFLIFVMARLPSPSRAFIAIALSQLIALHAQTAASILGTTLGDKLIARLRFPLQLAMLLLVGMGFAYAFASLAEERQIAGELREVFASGPVRVLLFPAAAAADFATAETTGETVSALLRLAAALAGSLLLVLMLPYDFRENSITASDRGARFGRGATDAKGGRLLTIPAPRALFLGASAVFWKNLVTLLRSARSLFGAVVVTAALATFAVFMAHESGGDAADALGWRIVSIAGMLPVMLTQHLAFDFRRDVDRLPDLKLLPLPASGIALAEVAVPTLVSIVLQLLVVGVAVLYMPLPDWVVPVAFLVFPPVSFAVCLLNNVGFLLHPVRGVAAGGRPSFGSASVSTLLGLLGLILAITPAVITFTIMLDLHDQVFPALAAGVFVQYVVDVILLALLARMFARFDVTRLEG